MKKYINITLVITQISCSSYDFNVDTVTADQLFKNIIEHKINFDDESMIIINISTPKQEILAQSILKQNQNKKLYIFCLGGGIAMACGEEEIVPNIIDDLNLEWFWRLKTNTWFRLKRLIYTSSIFFTKTKFVILKFDPRLYD